MIHFILSVLFVLVAIPAWLVCLCLNPIVTILITLVAIGINGVSS